MKRVLAPVLHDSAAPMSPSSRRRPEAPKWVFNGRLFLWTLGVVVLVVPAAMGWHALQLRLQTGAILEQVERDIEQEKWRSARNGLDHYLTLNPGDVEARARLAVVSDQFEQGQHILDMFAFAVAQFPERIDFRIRYAELHLALENYRQAISEAEVALKMQANEPRSLKVKAMALVNEGRRTNRVTPESIKEAVEEAIKAWPADIELVLQAAQAMRDMANSRGTTSENQAAMAGRGDLWLAELVKNQSENVDAWLARYAYRRQFRLDGWESDLDRAAELDPNSPGVLLALGQRALRRRDLNEAEKYFRLLVEQAPQQPEGFLNLSAVLRRQERFEEALRLLDGALRSVGRNELSLRMERITLQILGNQLDDVDAELQAIGRDVTRFSSQLEGSRQRRSLEEAMATLGAMYQLARGQSEQAIRTLRQVFPETRVSSPNTPNGQRHGAALEIIGQCHVIREEWELAGNALAEAARLLPERLDLAMQAAAAYERAGNWRRALRIDGELRMANTTADWDSADRNQLEHLAQSYDRFLERLEPAEAIKALRERIQTAPDDRFARRRLVAMLTDQGGEARWNEAGALLEEASGREWDSEVELARRQAVLELARSGDSAIPHAVKILRDEVLGSSEVEVEDHLFVAQLHGRQREFELEREQLNEALERQPGNALALGRLFDLVMDRREIQEAEQLLVRLEEVAQERLSTSQRRVRWLFADGQRDEARKLLRNNFERSSRVAMSDEIRAPFLVNFGGQFEAIEAFEDAERAYQQAYEVDPTTLPTLLGFLVRMGRGYEAVEKCRQLVGEAGTSEADAVEMLCRVLTHTQVTADTARELDGIIKTALQRHDRHVQLHYSAATYFQIHYQSQEDAAYARSLFERLNELRPNEPGILNNFAYFLSEQPDGLDEAREKIEQAIALAGETPRRLDTRGMVLFREGKWDEAQQDFVQAMSLSPSPQPEIRFHLALTQFRLGDVSAARESLRLADKEGLATAILSKKDRELREELEQALIQEAGS